MIFAIILATLDNRFKSMVTDVSHTAAEWIAGTFHYSMYVLLVTILFVVLFCGPYWLVFQIKNTIVFFLAALLILALDACCYVWLNAAGIWRYGETHFLVGILTMLICFFKPIRQKILFHF
ncbi:MAG TPA: hypothetical protein VKU83_04415 [Puia sp.]|nr:hypothetical protein [Puia sp.]